MTFLPFETIVIDTPLKKDEVISIFMVNIEPAKTFRFSFVSDSAPFEGYLRGNEFEIKRILNYRNSFQPVIKGRIETLDYGTRITVDMRLHSMAMIFISIWFAFVGVFFLMSVINYENDIQGVLFPLGMLSFGYAITMGGYLFESYKTKKLLTELVKGEVANDSNS